MPSMRIPYTGPLPLYRVIPPNANTVSGAVTALKQFIGDDKSSKTACLTGAGISVASGLADYRGPQGTYRLNQTYRPIYYHEFLSQHESRKRYWARSFIGFASGQRAKPNAIHESIKRLGELGIISSVVTQNVDSFHKIHPKLPTTELHGFLRSNICTTCHTLHDRAAFQHQLATLNPGWTAFLQRIVASGALDTEDPAARRAKGLRTNPDGDVDLPDVSYADFRYPPCPTCLADPPTLINGARGTVQTDRDGAWTTGSSAGVLKPAVVMFGEAIKADVKRAAEQAVDEADRLLVIGSSLATYSAWRLAKRARDQGKPLGILNLGGTRGEEAFFKDVDVGRSMGRDAFRCDMDASEVLSALVAQLDV